MLSSGAAASGSHLTAGMTTSWTSGEAGGMVMEEEVEGRWCFGGGGVAGRGEAAREG